MGGGTGGGGGGRGDRSPANFSAFSIMPMGGAWKESEESTSNGPRPPNRRAVAPPLIRDLFLHVLQSWKYLTDAAT